MPDRQERRAAAPDLGVATGLSARSGKPRPRLSARARSTASANAAFRSWVWPARCTMIQHWTVRLSMRVPIQPVRCTRSTSLPFAPMAASTAQHGDSGVPRCFYRRRDPGTCGRPASAVAAHTGRRAGLTPTFGVPRVTRHSRLGEPLRSACAAAAGSRCHAGDASPHENKGKRLSKRFGTRTPWPACNQLACREHGQTERRREEQHCRFVEADHRPKLPPASSEEPVAGRKPLEGQRIRPKAGTRPTRAYTG